MDEAVKTPEEQQPTSPPVQPVDSKTNSKTLLAIGGIVLLLIIGIGIYFLKSNSSKTNNSNSSQITQQIQPIQAAPTVTSDATANWETYKDKTGFAFRYPQAWKLTTKEISWDSSKRTNVTLAFTESGKEYNLIIHSIGSGSPAADQTKTEKIVLDGEEFTKTTFFKNNKPFFIWLISSQSSNVNKSMFETIQIDIPVVNQEEYIKIFNQILSTFKFTDQNQTVDVSNWKTYTNSLGGFSFNYPPEWEISGYKGTDPILSPLSNVIDLYSKHPTKDATNGDYMCIDLRLSENTYPIKDTVKHLTTIANNIKIDQLDYSYKGKTYPKLILTNNETGSIRLSNNKEFTVEASFNCVQGDIESVKLTYDQQVKSKEYNQALQILSTFKFTGQN